MTSIWIANYEGNEIRIENTWWNGERLWVNNELQDEQINYWSSNLTGYILGSDGQRKNIKVNIGGSFSMNCFLFVDHRKVEVMKQK